MGTAGRPDPLSYEQLASDTAELIRVLGLEKPCFMASAMAGLSACLLPPAGRGCSRSLRSVGRIPACGLKAPNRFAYRLIYAVTQRQQTGMMLHGPALTRAELSRHHRAHACNGGGAGCDP